MRPALGPMKRLMLITLASLGLASCSLGQPDLPPGITQADLDQMGNLTCTAFAAGRSFDDVASAYTDAGILQADAENLTRTAVEEYCPEYSDRVN